jgi:hypothetical protein
MTNLLEHKRIDYDYNRILLLDLEISPNVGRFYDKPWEARIIKTEQYQYLLCASWKWLGKRKITTFALPDFPNWKKNRFDDSALVKELWEAINQADALCAHNLNRFDIRKACARFIVNDLDPPHPCQMIDTLAIAKRKFGFIDNTLQGLCIQLGIGKKTSKTYSDLWEACLEGDEVAWKRMKRYNRQDVRLLEKLYKRLMPWIQPFPRLRMDNGKCPKCGGMTFKKNGIKYYPHAYAQRWKCLTCGDPNIYSPTVREDVV